MAIDNNDEEEALQTVKIERDDEQSEVPGLHDQGYKISHFKTVNNFIKIPFKFLTRVF
jgi:hypothetical protein